MKRTADVSKDQWKEQCENCLTWARHLMTFSLFLADGDLDIPGAFFSLVIEMESDDESAKLLAEQFWNPDHVHPEVEEKIQWLLKDWQKVTLKNKPRNVPLSLYYEKACQKFERITQRKEKTFGTFDQFVYKVDGSSSSSIELDETLYIGSRPFESEEDFLMFMDDFYAVSFNKLVDKEMDGQTTQQPPLLSNYAKELRHKELNSMVLQAVSSFQRKYTTSEAIYQSESPKMSPKISKKKSPKKKKNGKTSNTEISNGTRTNGGLFRSRSFSELRESSVPLFDTSPNKTTQKGAQGGGSMLDDETIVMDLPPITPRGEMANTSKLSVHTPRHRTSTPRKGKKQQKTTALKRSSSTTNLDTINLKNTEVDKPNTLTFESGSDPLTVPVLEPWILENMVFEKKYTKLERLLDWLNRWASRGNIINTFDSNNTQKNKYQRQQSVMRIKVPTRLILYSLWQLEQTYVTVTEQQQSFKARSPTQHVDNRRPVSGDGVRVDMPGVTDSIRGEMQQKRDSKQKTSKKQTR